MSDIITAGIAFELPFASEAEFKVAERLNHFFTDFVCTDIRDELKRVEEMIAPADLYAGNGGSHIWICRTSDRDKEHESRIEIPRWAFIGEADIANCWQVKARRAAAANNISIPEPLINDDMNFFQQLFEITPQGDLTLRIARTGEKVSVSVLPTTLVDVRPLVVTGTIAELDEGFMDAIRKPLQTAVGLVTNTEDFERDVAKAKPAPAEKRAAPASKKADSPGKVKDAKPAPEAAPKVDETPAAESEPTISTPATSPFPKDTRVIFTSPGQERGRIGTVQSGELTQEGKVRVLFDGYEKVAEMEPGKLAEHKDAEPPATETKPSAAPTPPKPAPPAPPMPPRPSADAATSDLFNTDRGGTGHGDVSHSDADPAL